MRNLPAPLAAHYASGTTTLATCWRVTLQDGTVLGFTDLDRPLTVAGVLYEAGTGFLPSAMQSQSRLAVDNQAMDGFLDSDRISAADLGAGRWDYAEVLVFAVNWRDLSQGIDIKQRGRLGEVSLRRGTFTAEFRGLANAYSQAVSDVYQPGCRTQLGSAACGVDLAAWTVSGTLSAVSADGLTLSDPARAEPADHFAGGKITLTSGASAGLSMEVKTYAPGQVLLQLQLPRGAAAGDTYTLHAGCNKTFATCVARFANGVNFRGEPHVPGMDQIVRFGGQ
jgi:uncharacterized phage protein (TIGR02218 family)